MKGNKELMIWLFWLCLFGVAFCLLLFGVVFRLAVHLAKRIKGSRQVVRRQSVSYWYSRQATDYWRAKFKDETVQREQQETLLRASQAAETPDTLLRPAQEAESQTPTTQLVRAAAEQEQP